MNNLLRWTTVLCFTLLAACGGEEETSKVENLTVDVQIVTAGEGEVEIIASADNVKILQIFLW